MATAAAAPPSAAAQSRPAAQAQDIKWEPLVRDYQTEFAALQQQTAQSLQWNTLKATDLHPLVTAAQQQQRARMLKEQENKGDEKDSKDSKRSSVVSPAKPSGDDPLRSMSRTQVSDPLRSAASSPAVVDPLRATATPLSPVSSNPLSPSSAASAAMLDRKSAPASSTTASYLSASSSAAAAVLGLVTSIGPNVVAQSVGAKKKRAGNFEMWTEKRPRILKRYTTNQRVAVTADFLTDEEEKKAVVAVDQTQSRLAQLEEGANQTQEQKNFLTQKEYIAHIEEQHQRLRAAWDADQRVLALKIAIQCAKLLGDTTVPQFYPSMFVLLSDILDTFGELVYERIRRRGVDAPTSPTNSTASTTLPPNFRCSDVSAQAKETCRNWFYKTACIRELLPRLYIDLALIKCYRFLEEGTYGQILERVSRAIRGIGDPLVATFARAYLTSKAISIADSFVDEDKLAEPNLPAIYQRPLLEAFDDFLYTYKALKAENFQSVFMIKIGRITIDEYVDLFSPAVEWMLQTIGLKSNEELFFALLQQYQGYCNNSAVLVHLLGSFNPSFVSNHANHMTGLIKDADENTCVKKWRLYLALGKSLVAAAPPQNQRLAILEDVWKIVSKLQDPDEYIEIAHVFVQYMLINFTDREVNIFLKDVIKHVRENQAYKRLQAQIASIVQKIMQYNTDIDKILAMDNFLPVLDLLEKNAKVPAGKIILAHFANTKASTSDPVIIHTLFDIAKSLHDSLDSLSFDDEKRQISHLLIRFIRKVDFGRDFEAQLNTYVDFRQAFTKLDSVTKELVERTCLLAARAHQFMKGKHTRKTSAFVKACLAYCHITIPSLDDIMAKLYLNLQCGQVALMNQMVVQAEAFIKSAITLIPDVPHIIEVTPAVRKSTEEDLVSFLRSFASFLLLFPGHPKMGPFYLIQGLLNAIDAYAPWKQAFSPHKTQAFLGMLQLFCAYAQRNFLYHIDRVESNDVLYGGSEEYQQQVRIFINNLLTSIVAQITEISEKTDILSRKQCGTLALDAVNVFISSLTVQNNPATATLIVKLFQLAKKSQAVDAAYLNNTLAHVENKRGSMYQEIAAKLRTA